MEKGKKRSNCPISSSLDIFGDKWSLLIIRDMMFFNKSTYGEFLKSDEKIATNILASRLQALEENKLIVKLQHPESKAKVLYRLTQKGIDLLPMIVEIHFWADKYFDIPANISAMIKDTNQGKDEFIQTTKRELEKQLSV